MFDIWKSLKDFVSVNQRKVHISNPVFQLHYKVTVTILLLFSILVTSRQYLGDPIDCISSQDVKNIAERYCWIHATFTRGRKDEEGRWSYEAVEESEISAGIRPAVEGDRLIFHYYYQWVWCVLFLQAGLFYFPHWLWKYGERGRLKMLVSDLNACVIVDEESALKHKEAILHYFSPNKGHHTFYAWRYIICEILCLGNIFLQMFGLDIFLNNQFSSYGLKLFSLPHTRPFLRHDALARVFPTVTACRIATGGVAFGTVEYDLLCVLPINILNEKIFIFLWFWFILVAVASVFNLVYRSLTLFFPVLRKLLLRRQARRIVFSYSDELLNLGYGDWFILHKLGENINPVVFGELLADLAGKQQRDAYGRLVCGEGWVQQGRKCYKLFAQLKTFDDAEAICKTQGGHLTSVASESEHNFLIDYILREVKESELKYVWIGGKRKKLRYIWMDLEPFIYTIWHSTFADVQKYPLNNCIQLATAAGNYEADQTGFGKFLLQPCTGKDNFICQRPSEFKMCFAGGAKV